MLERNADTESRIRQLAWPEARLLALNNEHAVETSRLTARKLRSMLSEAFLATGIGDLCAFLIAFDQGADYDSANFLWFRSRLRRFVYVDRVVTSPDSRGRGLARRLYGDLLERAARADLETVCCEVNLDPPNPASESFHAALGFEEVGRATFDGGRKTVRYLARPIVQGAGASSPPGRLSGASLNGQEPSGCS